MILTSAKNNHVAPNNRTLTVAKTKKVRRAPYRETEENRSDYERKENQKPGGRVFLQSDGKELAYASEDHDPANRQVDEPTM